MEKDPTSRDPRRLDILGAPLVSTQRMWKDRKKKSLKERGEKYMCIYHEGKCEKRLWMIGGG